MKVWNRKQNTFQHKLLLFFILKATNIVNRIIVRDTYTLVKDDDKEKDLHTGEIVFPNEKKCATSSEKVFYLLPL